MRHSLNTHSCSDWEFTWLTTSNQQHFFWLDFLNQQNTPFWEVLDLFHPFLFVAFPHENQRSDQSNPLQTLRRSRKCIEQLFHIFDGLLSPIGPLVSFRAKSGSFFPCTFQFLPPFRVGTSEFSATFCIILPSPVVLHLMNNYNYI